MTAMAFKNGYLSKADNDKILFESEENGLDKYWDSGVSTYDANRWCIMRKDNGAERPEVQASGTAMSHIRQKYDMLCGAHGRSRDMGLESWCKYMT